MVEFKTAELVTWTVEKTADVWTADVSTAVVSTVEVRAI